MYEHPNALIERRTAGLYVAVAYLPLTDLVGLNCEVNGNVVWKSIEKADALDAFEHPMLHLSPAQVAQLFPRPTVEAEAYEVEDVPSEATGAGV